MPSVAGRNELERRVLLELVTDPPAEGDEPSDLAVRLLAAGDDVRAAVDELVWAGLAMREDGRVRATIAARRFEALWPIKP